MTRRKAVAALSMMDAASIEIRRAMRRVERPMPTLREGKKGGSMFGKAGRPSVKPAGERDPARLLLATRIGAREALQRRLELGRAAVDKMEEALFDTLPRLGAANAEEELAAEHEVERLVAAGGLATIDRAAAREARSTREDLEADIAAAKAALKRVKLSIAADEQALVLAEMRIDDAIGAVVAGSVGPVVERIERLRREYEGQCALLRLLAASAPPGSDTERLARQALSAPSPGSVDYPAPGRMGARARSVACQCRRALAGRPVVSRQTVSANQVASPIIAEARASGAKSLR